MGRARARESEREDGAGTAAEAEYVTHLRRIGYQFL